MSPGCIAFLSMMKRSVAGVSTGTWSTPLDWPTTYGLTPKPVSMSLITKAWRDHDTLRPTEMIGGRKS